MTTRAKIIIGLVVVALAGGGFFYYWNFLRLPTTSLQPLTAKPLYKKAEELHHEADPKSIEVFEKLLAEEKDPNRRAYIQASIASDLYLTGGEEGKRKGVERIKAAIADPAITDGVRAGLVNSLLDMGVGIRDLDFMEKVFFAGEPYQTFYKEENQRISAGMRRMWEWSLEFFPTSYAHLQLAHFYAQKVFREDYNTRPAGERITDIKDWKRNLERGGALIERDSRFNSASRQISLYALRAVNHADLALQRAGDMAAAEVMFKDAILRAEFIKDDIHLKDLALGIRLQYAIRLSELYGASRQTDACALLTPFTALKAEDVKKYSILQWAVSLFQSDVEHPLGYAEPYPTHTDLYKLAAKCSDIRTLIEQLAGKPLDELLKQKDAH